MPNHRKALAPAALQQLQDVRFRGACSTEDAELFYPGKGGSNGPAKRICAGCGVRELCLEYALAANERFGIFGGTTHRERRRLRHVRRERAA